MMHTKNQKIKKSKNHFFVRVFSCFLVFLFSFSVAAAFNNPPANPPTGSGAIVTNASNNVGIGTTNSPGSRLTVRSSSAGTVFAIRNTADTVNTFAVSDTGAITLGSMAWSLLTNFPAGCSAGYAVQTIGTNPTCIAVGTGTVTGVTASAPLASSGGTAPNISLTGTVGATNGGTSQSTYAAGDLLYAPLANTLARLAGGVANNGKFLTVSGGLPAWGTPATGITSLNGLVTAAQTFANDTNVTISSSLSTHTLGWSGTLAVARGGTGAANALTARANLGAAASGANSDITSLSGLTTDVSVSQGGTGLSASGASGNVLTSNGVAWVSQAPTTGMGGSGTTNKVPKFTAASTLGDSQIFDNGTSVGVGTAAPSASYKMELAGGGLLLANNMSLAAKNNIDTAEIFMTPRASDNVTYMNFGSAGLNIRNNSSLSRMFIEDAGDVGINTAVPGYKLDVQGGDINTSGVYRKAGVAGATATCAAGQHLSGQTFSGGIVTTGGTCVADTSGTVTSVTGSGGTTGLTLTGGPITTTGTLTLGGTLALANGGTGAINAVGARTNLGAAASGANSDITSLSGLTTDLSVAQGGTGLSASGASGNVLTSNGVAWVSQAPTSGVGGSGSANYVPKFTAASTIGNSQIFDNGTNVGIGTASPKSYAKLDVNTTGNLSIRTMDAVNGGLLLGYQGPSVQGRTTVDGNGDLYLNNFGGNVGIGTVAPTQKLTVAGNVDIGTNYLSFGGNVVTDSTAGINWHTTGAPVGNFSIYRSAGAWSAPNYQQLVLDWPSGMILNPGTLYGKSYVDIQGGGLRVTAGNVGIGTISPGGLLHINATVTTGTTVGQKDARVLLQNNSVTGNAGGEIVLGVAADSATGRYAAVGTDIKVNSSGSAIGDVYIATKAATADTALTRRLVVTSGGDVGIGTTLPGQKLDVQGGDINTSGVYRKAGVAGVNATCAAGQHLSGQTFSGGIVTTGGTCVADTAGGVTSVTASSPLSSTGGATPNISLGTVPVANGGTGAGTLSANAVLLGNGTSPVTGVAPGASGNILTSDGSTWVSQAISGTLSSLQRVKMGYPSWSGSGSGEGAGYGRSICPSGKKVVGGGCRRGTSASEVNNCRLALSFPVYAADGDGTYNPFNQEGWYCEWRDRDQTGVCGGGTESAYAICM